MKKFYVTEKIIKVGIKIFDFSLGWLVGMVLQRLDISILGKIVIFLIAAGIVIGLDILKL